MPPRARPTKQASKPLTAATLQRILARAAARNGDNTILLDMAQSIGKIQSDVGAIKARLEVVEPALWKLEAMRLEGQGRRKLFGGIIKVRHGIYAAIAAAGGYFGIQLPKLP